MSRFICISYVFPLSFRFDEVIDEWQYFSRKIEIKTKSWIESISAKERKKEWVDEKSKLRWRNVCLILTAAASLLLKIFSDFLQMFFFFFRKCWNFSITFETSCSNDLVKIHDKASNILKKYPLVSFVLDRSWFERTSNKQPCCLIFRKQI